MSSNSPYHFSFFRIILGLYLCIHFLQLIPYSPELWSSTGLLPDPSVNLTYGILPNILHIFSSEIQVIAFVIILFLLSFSLLIGYQRRIVSLFLWYGWICLFDRNNLISNPSIPFIGWLLLCCIVIPAGEPLSISRKIKTSRWAMPITLFIGAWVIMSLGYTISGLDKLQAPSWRDGTAIIHLLENPLARDSWFRDFLVKMPELVIQLMTWSILFLEIIFLPLALLKLTRKWVWLAMILMHLSILVIVDFADLTLGMLMIHWFTFDGKWFKSKNSGIVFFDGVCSLCNDFIDFLIPEDNNNMLTFASLQGTTAQQKLNTLDIKDLDSIIYLQNGKSYKKSDAIIHIMTSLGGIWGLASVLRIIPRFIRDKIYIYIANHRYKWFGKKETCRMPTPEERDKILP